MRLGWDEKALNAPEMARRAEEAGVQMLTIHGRTRSQFFRGAADWAAIAPVVQAVCIPVIANGDIGAAAEARRALALSGAAGVMIGRAAQGKPWLPAAMERALRQGGEVSPPPRARLSQSLLELYADTLAFYDGALGVRIARKHIAWMIDAEFGVEARDIRKQICTLEDPRRVRDALIRLFDDGLEQAAA
jgi:tRNA-dihydrouridine synthase